MDHYYKNREAILQINEETAALIRRAETVLGHSTAVFEQWKKSSADVARNLIDHIMRIAVVGAIKSGKSTLVNALLQDDYLKRGAGVVTSIVTRMRRGNQLRARLYLKSWDQINAEIDQALVLFPAEQWQREERRFDIRRSKDRHDLAEALHNLDAELHVAADGLNADSVLLSSYLKGFDRVHSMIGAESTTVEFKADRFADHRTFVGDDHLAVYLKDIQLDITGPGLDTNIEMADCQGSDSPNPLHMAMIQDYLLKAHLIIYVISSRTGLRQADIRFLSIIKQMGIAHNMLFVCNCDIDEHESVSDLNTLLQKISEELSLMLPEAQLFVFSALHHLFDSCRKGLSARDAARLSQWEKSNDLVAFSNAEIVRLKATLGRKLTQERSALMLQNQIERIDILGAGLVNWIKLNQNLLQRNAGEAQALAERIQSHQGYMLQVQSMIRGTLDGGIEQINKELKKKVDDFFDRFNGPLLNQTLGFVRNHRVDLTKYREQVFSSGFTHVLYIVFQEFKRSVDTYMTESVNPAIHGFIGRLEAHLCTYLHSVVEPYEAMINDAVRQYEGALAQLDTTRWPGGASSFDTVPDLESVKRSIGLSLPPAAATMRYSAQIKTDAIVRMGLYAVLRLVRRALKKPLGERGDDQIQALEDGIRRMKRETERSIQAHFRDYQENIKFQYLRKLVDAAGRHLFEGLTEHFQIYVSDLKTLAESMHGERSDKEQIIEALREIKAAVASIQSRIETLRHDVDEMRSEQGVLEESLNARTAQM
jgi:GTPase SAR1 family protein